MPAAADASGGGKGGAKRMSRAERDALAAQRLAEQERALRVQQVKQWASWVGAALLLVLLVTAILMGFSALDRQFQAAYRVEL